MLGLRRPVHFARQHPFQAKSGRGAADFSLSPMG